MAHKNCIFCQIATGQVAAEIVFQDDTCTIFRDISPQAPIHLLAIPNEHISSLDELAEDRAVQVGQILNKVAAYARAQGLQHQGYRVVTNCGAQAGQSVFHLHFHLLAGRSFTWPPG